MSRLWMRAVPVAAALFILIYQLLIPPAIAVPDNGDYTKMISAYWMHADLSNDSNPGISHTVMKWVYDPKVIPGFTVLSSEWLVLTPAILVWRIVSSAPYDIRWTGVTHMALYLVSFWLVAPVMGRQRGWKRVLLWCALLAVLCDGAYTAYFDTFYTDASSFIFFALAAALYVRLEAEEGDARRNTVWLLVALGLFLTSKLQHALTFLPLLGLWWMGRTFRGKVSRRTVYAGAAVIVIFGLMGFVFVHPEYQVQAAYNVIFLRLVPHSPDRLRTLEEFNLDGRYLGLAGTNAYEVQSGLNSALLRPKLLENARQKRLAAYYPHHPEVAWMLIKEGLTESAREFQSRYGYYTLDSGVPPRTPPRKFTWWSRGRAALFRLNWGIYLAFVTVLMGTALVLAWRRGAAWFDAALTVVAMAGIAFGLSSLSECVETTRHLVFFRYLLDFLLLIAIGAVVTGRKP